MNVLLPHELTADHFDVDSDSPEYGDLYRWVDSFFGMRPDDVLDGILIALDEAIETAVGMPVVVSQSCDNRGLLQQRLTPEQLLEVWREVLGIQQYKKERKKS